MIDEQAIMQGVNVGEEEGVGTAGRGGIVVKEPCSTMYPDYVLARKVARQLLERCSKASRKLLECCVSMHPGSKTANLADSWSDEVAQTPLPSCPRLSPTDDSGQFWRRPRLHFAYFGARVARFRQLRCDFDRTLPGVSCFGYFRPGRTSPSLALHGPFS